jgi:hypothetical protein
MSKLAKAVQFLRKALKNERGQALAEYHVLIPGSIIMIWAAYIIGPGLQDAYRHVVYYLQGPKQCVLFEGAKDNSLCDKHEDCEKLEYEGMDSGSFRYKEALNIETVVIKAGRKYDIRRNAPYKMSFTTDDGCYRVTFKTNKVEWERIGEGKSCQAISHIDVWQAPLCE